MKHSAGERLVRDEIFIRVRAARVERILVFALVVGLVGVTYAALQSGLGIALGKVTAVLAAVSRI